MERMTYIDNGLYWKVVKKWVYSHRSLTNVQKKYVYYYLRYVLEKEDKYVVKSTIYNEKTIYMDMLSPVIFDANNGKYIGYTENNKITIM